MNMRPLGSDQCINVSHKIEYDHEFEGRDSASFINSLI